MLFLLTETKSVEKLFGLIEIHLIGYPGVGKKKIITMFLMTLKDRLNHQNIKIMFNSFHAISFSFLLPA